MLTCPHSEQVSIVFILSRQRYVLHSFHINYFIENKCVILTYLILKS